MNEKKQTEYSPQLTRKYCMNYGLIVGALCSISFLLSMYSLRMPLVGQLGNIVGLLAIYVAGRQIRSFRQEVAPLGFWRSCLMAIQIFLYATLLTAVVQYAYFAFLDHGRLASEMGELFSLPEYKKILAGIVEGGDAEAMLEEVTRLLRNPAQTTFQLMIMNITFLLPVSIPTAIIATWGKTKKENA